MGVIKHINIDEDDLSGFKKHYVGCVVLTQDNKILLQQRGNDWDHYPGYLCEFGGHIEKNEMPMQALVRELREELGAKIKPQDVISLGAVSEDSSNFTELVYVFFWHDKHGTITGCYEGEPRYFNDPEEPLKHDKMMDSVKWLLIECANKGLFGSR